MHNNERHATGEYGSADVGCASCYIVGHVIFLLMYLGSLGWFLSHASASWICIVFGVAAAVCTAWHTLLAGLCISEILFTEVAPLLPQIRAAYMMVNVSLFCGAAVGILRVNNPKWMRRRHLVVMALLVLSLWWWTQDMAKLMAPLVVAIMASLALTWACSGSHVLGRVLFIGLPITLVIITGLHVADRNYSLPQWLEPHNFEPKYLAWSPVTIINNGMLLVTWFGVGDAVITSSPRKTGLIESLMATSMPFRQPTSREWAIMSVSMALGAMAIQIQWKGNGLGGYPWTSPEWAWSTEWGSCVSEWVARLALFAGGTLDVSAVTSAVLVRASGKCIVACGVLAVIECMLLLVSMAAIACAALVLVLCQPVDISQTRQCWRKWGLALVLLRGDPNDPDVSIYSSIQRVAGLYLLRLLCHVCFIWLETDLYPSESSRALLASYEGSSSSKSPLVVNPTVFLAALHLCLVLVMHHIQKPQRRNPQSKPINMTVEICSYVRVIVRYLLKIGALKEFSIEQYMRQRPGSRRPNRQDFLTSTKEALNVAQTHFVPEKIDSSRLPNDMDVSELCRSLRGPVLSAKRAASAFQPGDWMPPGLKIETHAFERCTPGTGRRTARAILDFYFGLDSMPSFDDDQMMPSISDSQGTTSSSESCAQQPIPDQMAVSSVASPSANWIHSSAHPTLLGPEEEGVPFCQTLVNTSELPPSANWIHCSAHPTLLGLEEEGVPFCQTLVNTSELPLDACGCCTQPTWCVDHGDHQSSQSWSPDQCSNQAPDSASWQSQMSFDFSSVTPDDFSAGHTDLESFHEDAAIDLAQWIQER